MVDDATPVDALIIGGGIAGLASALALSHNGMGVSLVEKADEFGEVGAGLQIAPNATRILARWGLLEHVRDIGVEPRHLVFRDALSGEELTRQSFGVEFRNRYGAPYIVVHRSDLHSILLTACRDAGVDLTTDTAVQSTRTENGIGVATAADGTQRSARLLVGADGLESILRKQIVADEPVVSGFVAYRGTVPVTDGVSEHDLRDVVVYLGPNCHLVQYPLRRGKLLNTVAVYRSASFQRGIEQFEGTDELHDAYSDCVPQVRQALRNLGTGFRWPMYDREPTRSWRTGRLVLIGDAAHPMLQYLAQGACQALEDADVLGRLTAGADITDDAALLGVLDRFVAERAPRTARIQHTARVWGESWHVTGIGRTLRNMLFAARSDGELEIADWLYRAHEPTLAGSPSRPSALQNP